ADSRRVVVGPREALATRRVRLREVNWLGAPALDALPMSGVEVAARVRSTRAPKPGLLGRDNDGVFVELASAEEGVAPGQACVFYAHDGADAEVLGGGTILRAAATAISVAA
ncbi:MAG: aminomethyltransferase beta-barrel domain-containing protein, partial [Beijerinckiaceae bacterium]